MRNDVVKYVNSAGQEQYLNKGNVLCNTKALREFLYTVQNKRLYSNQQKTIIIELLFNGSPVARDSIIDVLEYDSIKNTYGRLYVNDWYILCRFTGIQSISKEGVQNIRMNLQFVADTIEWGCETHYELTPVEYPASDYPNNDYPYDYPHDYAVDAGADAEIVNGEIAPADIRVELTLTSTIITLGKVKFTITDVDNNTHDYEVDISDYTVVAGYKFKLDTQAKTVEILSSNGSFSVFGGTSDDYYIFEQLKTGTSIIATAQQMGDVSMSVDVIEHRRQPKWKI